MKTTLEILIEARALIAKPRDWCQNSLRVVNQDGVIRQRCAFGAIQDASEKCALNELRAQKALHEILPCGWPFDVPAYNDTHYHWQVLEMFDRAIEEERAKLGDLMPARELELA